MTYRTFLFSIAQCLCTFPAFYVVTRIYPQLHPYDDHSLYAYLHNPRPDFYVIYAVFMLILPALYPWRSIGHRVLGAPLLAVLSSFGSALGLYLLTFMSSTGGLEQTLGIVVLYASSFSGFPFLFTFATVSAYNRATSERSL